MNQDQQKDAIIAQKLMQSQENQKNLKQNLSQFVSQAPGEITKKTSQSYNQFLQRLKDKSIISQIIVDSQTSPNKGQSTSLDKKDKYYNNIKNQKIDKEQKIKNMQNTTLPEGGADPQLNQVDAIQTERTSVKQNSPPKRKITNDGKLNDAKNKKQQLEYKLKQLEEEIQILENSQVVSPDKQEKQQQQQQQQQQNKVVQWQNISENKEAQLKALELVKKMNQIRKQQIDRQKRIQEQVHDQYLLQIQNERKQREETKEKQKQEKRQVIVQRLEEFKQKKVERIIFDKRSNIVLKDLQTKGNLQKIDAALAGPLQQQSSSLDNKISESSELEKRKKELAMKRQMYNPHEVASQKPLKVEKTMFTQKVLEEQKQIREEMIKKEEDKKEQLIRRMKYGKIVKDLYKPKISSAQKISLQERQDKVKRNTSQSHKVFNSYFQQKNQNVTQCSSPEQKNTDDNLSLIHI
eukprot:TRINITY_DN595_c0_g1_i6.p1 TRINITY_DN595_c0_g1~~TRINITY_DN595_c0_g1_i6.p1  ORF type:complete len:464 (-),score=122.16 TRINITY_DN595_c0_g1_i6:180-1571(-)